MPNIKPDQKALEVFLKAVDCLFPVPLSHKQDLGCFAKKLYEKATVCHISSGGEILSLTAGYTDNVTDNIGYISVVASLPKARGNGYAKKTIEEFIGIARQKGLDAVHLYAVPENIAAVNMYRNIGFEEWRIPEEPRPDDLHLIFRIKENGK